MAVSSKHPVPSDRHPLEPLTPQEIERAVAILRRDRQLSSAFRFVAISLVEPPKPVVLVYRPGDVVSRDAFAILLDSSTGIGYEAVVNLDRERVVSYTALAAGVQPPIMADEFLDCEEAVKKSPEFLAALKKRGIDDVNLVMVDPWAAGFYGNEREDEKHLRLSRALCWVRTAPNENGYGHPVDGIVAVVDLNRRKVLRIEDYGVIPLPPEPSYWTRDRQRLRTDLKPLEVVQPEGPSFRVTGHQIEWQKWKFRIAFTPREGLVLYTISYRDGERERPILYRASVAEMVVPYGDPAERHFRKNAFDIGEYGIGTLANSLTLGCDCLGVIKYFDGHMVNSRGEVATIRNAVCLHEEDYGMLWKHTDWRTGEAEVRRSRRLVVSFIATVGNYEYGFFWYFYQDGTIQLEVKLTGIINTTSLKPGERPKYGTEVAPQLHGPNHQHIFNARLDMCVDGFQNSVYEINALGLPRSAENPHGNAFVATPTLLESELRAQRTVNAASSRFWRIVNPNKTNRLGQPVAYRLIAQENGPPFAQADAAVLKRAGFVTKNLWVTPYEARERYPAGDYPNQNPGGDGLPKWTRADRKIVNTNVVVWYTFGHTHIPRLEDWPVMPVSYIGFTLKPDGFFESNPALDVPPSEPKK